MKKYFGATLVGLWTSWMFTLHLNHALKQAFGININFAFSELASMCDNSVLFIANFICFFFGVFVSCYVTRERYWISGISTLCCNVFLIAALLVVSFLFGVVPPWLPALLLVDIVAGISGILAYKHLKKRTANNFKGDIYPYLDYYFALRWRTGFTIILFFTAIWALIKNLLPIVLFLKWLVISPFFTLCHPRLWMSSFFFDIGEFAVAPLLLIIIPLYFIHWVYEIGVSERTKLRKIIYLVLLFVGLNLANTISAGMVTGPIERSVTHFATSGQEVWSILLDRYTRPLERELISEYLIEEGKESEASQVRDESIEAYLDLAHGALKGENLQLAEKCSTKIAKLCKNDDPLVDMAFLYFDFEIYNQSAEMFEKILENDSSDVEIMEYLANCYNELGEDEKTLALLRKQYPLIKDSLAEQGQKEILDYIEYLEERLSSAKLGSAEE